MGTSFSPPRVIICDLGNVLVDVVPSDKARVSLKCAVPPEEVRRFFFESEEFFEYERGRISTREFCEVVRERLGYSGSYGEFLADFRDIFTLNSGVYELLFGEVKMNNDVEFWILSNINEFHHECLSKRWPGIFSSCRHVFLSYKLGLRKPQSEIWRHILKEGGARPDECLLIDDLDANCVGASEAGIASIVFNGIVFKLREELKSCGLRLERRHDDPAPNF